MFDMNRCKPGDKLISEHGTIVTYVEKISEHTYPHKVKYPDGSEGSRCDDGFVFKNFRMECDENIVGFAKEK